MFANMSNTMILVIIIIIIIIVALILHQNDKKFARMELLTANIPGPKGYPVIGGAFELAKGDGILENMIEIINFCGRESKMYKLWLGPKLFITLSSPDDIEEILSSPDFINKSFVYSFLKPLLGLKSVFTSNDEAWKKRRKMIMPTFQLKMIEQFMDIFNKNSQLLVENLNCELSKPGFDVLHYNDLFTTDVIAETALGVEVGVQRTKNFELCKDILHRLEYLFIHRVSRPWTHPDIIFNMTNAGHEQKKLLEKLYGFIEGIIVSKKQKRMEEKDSSVNNKPTEEVIGEKKRKAFMDALLDSYEKGDNQLTNKDISGEVVLIMIAGQSTTAATISYAMHALSKHQDIQEKVVEELNGIFDGSDRNPTFHDINEMKYMEMVLKETMRMWPAVPYIARSVPKDIQLKSGYTLPAGSDVVIFIYALHRNPDVYPDPDVFNPERFNYENSKGRSMYAHCPFAAGPRICVGQKYAMTEMKIALTYILRKYKILPPSKDFPDMKLTSEMVLRSTTGVNIRIERR